MAQQSAISLLIGLGIGAVVFGAIGYVAGSGAGAAEAHSWSAKIELVRAEAAAETARLQEQLATARARPRPRAAEAATAPEVAEIEEPLVEVVQAATESAEAVEGGLNPAERAQRAAQLRAQFDGWFEGGDGASAVAALKELAALAPEGRQAAMELAVLINEDVNGKGRLGLNQYTFYTGLGDPAIRDLMNWSLGRDDANEDKSLQGFRVISVWSLPWTQPTEKTVAQFAAALATETNPDVQNGLIQNLARMRTPESIAALSTAFADTDQDGAVRAQIVTQLAFVDDPAIVQSIQRASENDLDVRVRDAARATLIARDPPRAGYLITGTLPDGVGSAAGVRAGDIVVSYNGVSTRDGASLRGAQEADSRADNVEVVVLRDGAEVRMTVPVGRLGVYGVDVKPREK